MLRTENLSIHIHKNLNWTFESGKIAVIRGPNAIGKSMLLDTLSGIRRPSHGFVYFENRNLADLAPRERAARISSLGQHDTAPGDTCVQDRILHGVLQKTEHLNLLSRELNIEHLLARKLRELSGGEKKRVHIARCLIHDTAQVYILDEPDAGLDQASKQLLRKALHQKSQAGKLVIISTHDMLTANEIKESYNNFNY